MQATVRSPKSDDRADITTILHDLDRLRAEEIEDRQATLERKYERLQQAYAHGLILRDDENLREQFFGKESWEGFAARKAASYTRTH